MPLVQDVTIPRGDGPQLLVPVTNLPSGGLNAYSKIWFTAKRDITDSDAQAFLSLTLAGGGIAITTNGSDTVDGLLTITIPASATATLPGYDVRLAYDVQVLDSTQNPVRPHTIAQGTLTVAADVTQAVS